jgi:hypothetical protein
MFATTIVSTEQHRIDRLRDGLWHELRNGLIALHPKTIRELVEAAQSLEVVLQREN